MYRFLLQCICIIIIHSASRASSAPSKRDDQTAQIDEFIGKILGSDKFELLADKIADRAAEKIKNLQMRSIIQNGPSNGDSEKDLEEIKEEYTTTETLRTEKHRGKPGNIDMQAAMEKFVTMIPEEKLSLKYENFVNGNVKASNDLSEETTTDKHHRMRDIERKKDKNYLEHDEATKRNVNSEPRLQHNKIYKGLAQYQNKHVSESRSLEKKSLKQSPKYDNDDEPPEESVKTQKKDHSEQIEYEVEMTSAEKEFIKTSKDDNQKDDLSRIFRTNEKKSSKHPKEETDETDAETGQENQVSDENNKEIVQVENIYETREIKDRNSNVTANITVRREGEKLFAFDPSPEYADYHEKFAKMKKKLLNTNGIGPTTLPT